jgi:hypothetical protein
MKSNQRRYKKEINEIRKKKDVKGEFNKDIESLNNNKKNSNGMISTLASKDIDQ